MSTGINKAVGAIYLDVPVISSFIPSNFTRYALIHRLEEKEGNYAANQYKSYYNIAQKRVKKQKRIGLKSSEPAEVSNYTKKEIKENHLKYGSDSVIAPFYRFFAKHPYVQMTVLVVITALGTCLLSLVEDYIIDDALPKLKTGISPETSNTGYRCFIHILWCLIFSLISVFCTASLSPEAGSGSGIPELKAVLSGVSFPQFTSLSCLLGKYLGNFFAIAGGLFVGRVGPITSISFVFCYLILEYIPIFRNFKETESIRRNILSFAVSVGIAITIYAPIGGVLFSIEVMCEIFLTQYYGLTFFAAGFAGLLFDVAKYIGYSPFYKIDLDSPMPPELSELMLFCVLGFVCALLSAVFIRVAKLTATFFRWIERGGKKKTSQKPIITSLDFPNLPPTPTPQGGDGDQTTLEYDGNEAIPRYGHYTPSSSSSSSVTDNILTGGYKSSSSSTASSNYVMDQTPANRGGVRGRSKKKKSRNYVGMCGSYLINNIKTKWRRYMIVLSVAFLTAFLTLPWGTFAMSGLGSGELFMYMLQKRADIVNGFEGLFGMNQNLNIFIVFLIKYIILPISMQIAVPAGIVMPSLVCGVLFGRLVGNLLYAISPVYFPSASLFGACGAASFLAATTQTLSPAIIVMEASELPNVSFACLLGVIVAYFTSVSLGDSLFTMIMKFRRIPYVSPSLPKSVDSENRRLEDIMSTKRLFVTPRTTVKVLKEQRDFAVKLKAPFIPIVKSEASPILMGSVSVQSVTHIIDNPILLEQVIMDSINTKPLVDKEYPRLLGRQAGKLEGVEYIGTDYSRLKLAGEKEKKEMDHNKLLGVQESSFTDYRPTSSSSSSSSTFTYPHSPSLPFLSSSDLPSASTVDLRTLIPSTPTTNALSLITKSNPLAFYSNLRMYGYQNAVGVVSSIGTVEGTTGSADLSTVSTLVGKAPPAVLVRPAKTNFLSPSNNQSTADYELSEVFLSHEHFVVDTSPFNLAMDTPLVKAHALFHLLSLNVCIVTFEGCWVGTVSKSDFTDMYLYDMDQRK